eukprot:917440_1
MAWLILYLLGLITTSEGRSACKTQWYPQCRAELARCKGEQKRLEQFNEYLQKNSFEEQFKNISTLYNESKYENAVLLQQMEILKQKLDSLQSSMESNNIYSQRIYALIEEALNPNITSIMPPQSMKDNT